MTPQRTRNTRGACALYKFIIYIFTLHLHWEILAYIGWYCYWEIFFRCDTQYDADRTAVDLLCSGLSGHCAEICLTDVLVCDFTRQMPIIIVIIIKCFRILHGIECCIYFTSNQYTATLHAVISIGIGITRGQYDWI